MKVTLSEKGGFPNTIRILIGGGLLVASGALFQHSDITWGILAIAVAVFLLGMSVSHNLFDNNYLIGFEDGCKEGSKVRGLLSPESDILEGTYRMKGSMQLAEGWAVILEDANMEGREPRVYKMKELPPPVFRKERWADPQNPDSTAYIHGYMPLGHVT